jgi:hypothetical protein
MPAGHGYGRYTNGCRCAVCRAAKAAYVRAKRASAAELRVWTALFGERYEATGITHGITGYQDHSCRCDLCRLAKAEATERETRRRKVSV